MKTSSDKIEKFESMVDRYYPLSNPEKAVCRNFFYSGYDYGFERALELSDMERLQEQEYADLHL